MKRKVVAAILTMAMAGSLLAGCGSSSSDDSSSKSKPQQQMKAEAVIPQPARVKISAVYLSPC